MALDLKWLLSADDKATPVFDKVQAAGKNAAEGIQNAFSGALGKFNLLTGAIGTLATVAGGMIFKSIINETVAWELNVAKLGNTLGMTTAQASVYAVAAHSVGVEQNTLESAGLKLAKTLGSNEDVFKKLGVATRDSTGHLRSTADLLPEVNQRLGDMKAGTDRNVIAMEIYGRSWNDVRSMLKINSEVMEEARETAQRLHLIVGDEGVKQAKEYKHNLNEISLVGKSLAIQFGNVLLPAVVSVGSFMGKNAPMLAEGFGYALQFVGKVAMTTGEWIGLMAYRVVTLASAVGNFVTGNFAGAKKDWQDMVAAGDDFSQKQKERWTDWSFKPATSKGLAGNQVDTSVDDAAKANKEKLAFMDKELAAFKELQSSKTALVKGQAEIESVTLKSAYDQGLITVREYYQAQTKAALESAQARADNAALYLAKEEEVLAFVKKAYGDNSAEFQAENGKHAKAVQDLQAAQLDYAKVYLDTEEKMRVALKARTDEYDKLKAQALELAGNYVAAEQKKQEIDSRSVDFLRLKKEAEAGVQGAVEALAAVEQKRSIDLVAAQNKEHEAVQQYLNDVQKMQDAVDELNGKDKDRIKVEGDLREGLNKELDLRGKLAVALVQSNSKAVSALNSEIELQNTLNARLQAEIDLRNRKGELTGQIVGYNNGRPIYANSYSNQQTANGYVSNAQLIGAQPSQATTGGVPTSTNSPFVNLTDPFWGGYRASGGPVEPYKTYIVGEKGPEVLRMGAQGGSVVPNGALGGDVNFNGPINFILPNVTDKSTAADLAREALPELMRLMKTRFKKAA